MRKRYLASALVIASALVFAGCGPAPGKPKAGPDADTMRPDAVSDVGTLYGQNCAGCHGDGGKHGAAISLASPLYLAFAGEDNLKRVIASGVPGTMMPGFQKSAGGMLTDRQITLLAEGIMGAWGDSAALKDARLPAYAGNAPGDPKRGQVAFVAYCASCHGADGMGVAHASNMDSHSAGSLVDPAYLALISDQGLRSILVAGEPEVGMPDYRAYHANGAAHALTEQEIGDMVAWLASHRAAEPGAIYQQTK